MKAAAKGRKSVGAIRAKEKAMKEAKAGVGLKSRFSMARDGVLGKKGKSSGGLGSMLDLVDSVMEGDMVFEEGAGLVLASSVKKALPPPSCLLEGNKVEYYTKRYDIYVMADIKACDLLSNTLKLMVLAKQERTGVPFNCVRVPLRIDERCEVYLNENIKWFGPATVTKMCSSTKGYSVHAFGNDVMIEPHKIRRMFEVDDNVIFLDEHAQTWNNARVIEVIHDEDSYVNLNPGDFSAAAGAGGGDSPRADSALTESRPSGSPAAREDTTISGYLREDTTASGVTREGTSRSIGEGTAATPKPRPTLKSMQKSASQIGFLANVSASPKRMSNAAPAVSPDGSAPPQASPGTNLSASQGSSPSRPQGSPGAASVDRSHMTALNASAQLNVGAVERLSKDQVSTPGLLGNSYKVEIQQVRDDDETNDEEDARKGEIMTLHPGSVILPRSVAHGDDAGVKKANQAAKLEKSAARVTMLNQKKRATRMVRGDEEGVDGITGVVTGADRDSDDGPVFTDSEDGEAKDVPFREKASRNSIDSGKDSRASDDAYGSTGDPKANPDLEKGEETGNTSDDFVKVDAADAAVDREPPVSSSSGMKIKSALKSSLNMSASPGKKDIKKMDSVAFERVEQPEFDKPKSP